MLEDNAPFRPASRNGRGPAASLLGRLPLGYQVAAAAGLLLAVGALSIAIAVLLVLSLRSDQAQLHGRTVPYANAIAAAALGAKAIANDERGFLLTGDAKFLRQIDSRIEGARAAFATALRTADGPEQRQAAAEAQAGFERWIRMMRVQFGNFEAGERRQSIAAALGPGRALRKDYERSLAHAQALGSSALVSGRSSVAAASSRSVAILLACLAAALALGGVVAFWLVRSVARPVESLVTLFADVAGVAPSSSGR